MIWRASLKTRPCSARGPQKNVTLSPKKQAGCLPLQSFLTQALSSHILALNGHLFPSLFPLCPPNRTPRLPFPLSRAFPAKHRPSMGRHPARRLYAPSPYPHLHLPQLGRRQHLVHRPPRRYVNNLLRRNPRNPPPQTAT